MLRRSLPLFLVTLFLLSGCSVLSFSKKSKKTQSQATVQTVPAQPIPAEEILPETSETASSDISLPQGPDSLPSLRKLQEKRQPQPTHKVPDIHFSEAESQHVRLPANRDNPFPSSGELTIDLNELQEQFIYPYPGKLISPYGYRGRSMHTGIDIKAIPHDTIRAALPGVVRMSKPYSGYGNTIVIRHYNGLETLYSHNSRNLVKVNDVVKAGDPIALAGRTGRATTEHLHFEVRVSGEHFNPTLMVNPESRSLREGTLYLSNRGGRIRASNKPLPLYADTNEQSEKEDASAVSSSTSSSSSKGTPQYHIIRKGDTLSALARRYGTTVSKICALNGIKPTKILQIKERIRVK